jgi:DNA-binding NarL/FixJ family response regulator
MIARRSNSVLKDEDTELAIAVRPSAEPVISTVPALHNNSELERVVVVIDRHQLSRECFARGLSAVMPQTNVASFASLSEWRATKQQYENVSAILLVIGDRKLTEPEIADDITQVVEESAPTPIIVVADTEALTQIVRALECGAKGYIPTSVGLRVATEAIGMTLAGGVFVPATSIMGFKTATESEQEADGQLSRMFTARQMAVVDALRRGRANKIIAYELQLCESTVKVHIRNIMRKLNATNRTEVAFKLRDMFSDKTSPHI